MQTLKSLTLLLLATAVAPTSALAQAGEPAPAAVEQSSAVAPPPAPPPEAPSGLVAPDPVAKEKYAQGRIWFAESKALARWTAAFRGPSEQLDGEKLYQALGRPDLASAYNTRAGVRLGLVGGGIMLGVFGMEIAGTVTAICSGPTCNPTKTANPLVGQVAGVSMLVLGAAMITTSVFFVDQHPISAEEAHRLVDAHNLKLRESLGLGQETADVRSAPVSELFAGVGPTQGGGALLVGGRF